MGIDARAVDNKPGGWYLQLERIGGIETDIEGRHWLHLVHIGDSHNFSSTNNWKGGGACTTHFEKLRIDPDTLKVHTGDITHATSIVSSSGDGNGACYDWVPYAACLDCLAAYTKTATANIDLRGTPFRVASEFKYDGHKASGSVTYSHNRQVVELAGGGHCGYTATVEAIDDRAVDNKPGGWYLQLERIGGECSTRADANLDRSNTGWQCYVGSNLGQCTTSCGCRGYWGGDEICCSGTQVCRNNRCTDICTSGAAAA